MKKSSATWQGLPSHFKESLVGTLPYSDRLALRSCSKADRDLVDEVAMVWDCVSFTFPHRVVTAVRPTVSQTPDNAAMVQKVLCHLPREVLYRHDVPVAAPTMWTSVIRSLLGTARHVEAIDDYTGILHLQQDAKVSTRIFYESDEECFLTLRALFDSLFRPKSHIRALDLWLGPDVAKSEAFLEMVQARGEKLKAEELKTRWNSTTLEILDQFDAELLKTLVILDGPADSREMEDLVRTEQWKKITKVDVGGRTAVPFEHLSHINQIATCVTRLGPELSQFIRQFCDRNLARGSFCNFRLPRESVNLAAKQNYISELCRLDGATRVSDLCVSFATPNPNNVLTVFFKQNDESLKLYVDDVAAESRIPDDAIFYTCGVSGETSALWDDDDD